MSDKKESEYRFSEDQPMPDDETADDPLAEPFAYRDSSERLPNESLREELESMTPEEQEVYLRHLEVLARIHLGPGGP